MCLPLITYLAIRQLLKVKCNGQKCRYNAVFKLKGQPANDIEYMCDLKIRVNQFKAYPRSRFGGNETFVIWDRKPKPGTQLTIG